MIKGSSNLLMAEQISTSTRWWHIGTHSTTRTWSKTGLHLRQRRTTSDSSLGYLSHLEYTYVTYMSHMTDIESYSHRRLIANSSLTLNCTRTVRGVRRKDQSPAAVAKMVTASALHVISANCFCTATAFHTSVLVLHLHCIRKKVETATASCRDSYCTNYTSYHSFLSRRF